MPSAIAGAIGWPAAVHPQHPRRTRRAAPKGATSGCRCRSSRPARAEGAWRCPSRSRARAAPPPNGVCSRSREERDSNQPIQPTQSDTTRHNHTDTGRSKRTVGVVAQRQPWLSEAADGYTCTYPKRQQKRFRRTAKITRAMWSPSEPRTAVHSLSNTHPPTTFGCDAYELPCTPTHTLLDWSL